jgi:hypothetical protein
MASPAVTIWRLQQVLFIRCQPIDVRLSEVSSRAECSICRSGPILGMPNDVQQALAVKKLAEPTRERDPKGVETPESLWSPP